MNLEQLSCDQLRKIVANQIEQSIRNEKRMKEKREADAEVLASVGLVILATFTLTALGSFFSYLWNSWKTGRAGPVTRIPKTPISKKNLWGFSASKTSKASVYHDSIRCADNRCTGKLEEIMMVVLNLESSPLLSSRIRVISIKIDGFNNGTEFHSFEPEDGVIPASYFTYQMFGDDTIQVTRYVVGNKSYVAGFCIYIKNDSVKDIDINMNIIKKLMKTAKYPGKEAVEKRLKEDLEKMVAGKTIFSPKFAFWKRTQQNDVPPSYSSLSVA